MSRNAPLRDRLWRRVVKTNGCWLWTGYRTKQGYGVIGTVGVKTGLAHRVAWELTNGAIPDGLFVCHHCDNPPCVNPEHLFLGTNADNVADREAKGRQLYRKPGTENGRAKLTEDLVKAIHADTRKQDDIAAAFGVSQSTVHRIKARTAGGWKHISLPEKRTFARKSSAERMSLRDLAIVGGEPSL